MRLKQSLQLVTFMSKLTEQMELVSLQEKRDRIVKIHRRLHSDSVKLEKPLDTLRTNYYEPQTEESPRLTRTDVRKILGDPLPLPYMIESRRRSNSSVNISMPAKPSPGLIKKANPLPHDAHLRLQNSIRNLQKVPIAPQNITPEPVPREMPLFTNIETPILKHRHVLKTPSPPVHFSKRITDANSKNELLREFRSETQTKVDTQLDPKVDTKKPKEVAFNAYVALRAVLFMLLLTCIYYVLN